MIFLVNEDFLLISWSAKIGWDGGGGGGGGGGGVYLYKLET